MPKKCPACNSTRYEFVNDAHRCRRCGYTHKSVDVVNKELSLKEFS